MALGGAGARSARSLVLTLVLASLVTITVDYRQGQDGPLAGLGRLGQALIAPLQGAVTAVIEPVGDALSALGDLPSLEEQNRQLRDRIKEMQAEAIRVEELLREAEDLQRIFDLQEGLGLRTVGAHVIGSGVSNFEWSITIDRGSDAGIRLDMPVIAPGGLVGRVVSVTSSSARVLLILDPDSHVSALIRTGAETPSVDGLVVGHGDRDLGVEFADTEIPVAAGMVVVTSGIDGSHFPAGIPIGEVSRALPGQNAVQQAVQVRPYVDFSTLREVAVVLGRSDE